jgi:hypothetical protein
LLEEETRGLLWGQVFSLLGYSQKKCSNWTLSAYVEDHCKGRRSLGNSLDEKGKIFLVLCGLEEENVMAYQ